MNDEIVKDHDLLIELRTEFKGMRDDIKELKDNLVSRVSTLEQSKVDNDIAQDHEGRIRRLEYALAISVGAFGLFEILLRFYK